jgi:carbamoyltransferase
VRILGISCDFHDAAAAVVSDGEVVAAAEQERFSRAKHDPSLPVEAIASVLATAGLEPDDVDYVAFHEKPLVTLARVLSARQSRGPAGLVPFSRELPQLLRRNLFVGLRIERALRSLGARRRPRLRYSEHHLSHAAAAYYPSPFDGAAVLTVDGIGEWATASIGRGVGNRLELLAEQRYPDSLGLLYSLVTEFCGFAPNDGEYKLMGLAPYGEPTMVERLRELATVHDDGSVSIDQRAVGRWTGDLRPATRVLGRDPLAPGAPVGRPEADLARSMQVLLEEAVLAMAEHARELTGERALCLAGGVALNCVANGRLRREGPFDEVWVQPAAGDAGSAVGAALWLAHDALDQPRPTRSGADGMHGALLGPAMPADEVAAWLASNDVPHVRIPDRAERAGRVADALAAGAYVGWFEGAMEFGPRALGHRSILADPRSPTAQHDLNLRIKERESFRPFAPAVLEERAGEWFDVDGASPYMLFTCDLVADRRTGEAVHPTAGTALDGHRDVRSQIPACTHVDHSARVQTVAADRDDGFRAVLEAFDQRTGCPVLVNTSFNGAGEPIVCTPDDAVGTARRIGLDLLVVEDCLVRGEDLPAELEPGTWAQAPRVDVDAAAREGSGPGTVLSLLAVAAAPGVRAGSLLSPAHGAAVAAVVAAVAFGARRLDDARWWARLALFAATAAGCGVVGGWTLGAWVGVALVAVDAVAHGHRVLPPLPAGDRNVLPALVALSAVLAWVGRQPGRELRVQVLVVAMAVVVTVTALLPGRLSDLTGRFGRWVGTAVGQACAFVLGIPALLLPWLAHRLVRIDPLRPGGQRPTTAWVRREPSGARPAELWRRDPAKDALPVAWRARRLGGSFLVFGALALLVGAIVVHERDAAGPAPIAAHQNTDPNAIPAALAGDAWYPEYSQDIAWLWRTSVSWDPLAPVRLRDVRTRHINIVDGARVSWRPPACRCRRVTVWMYGGSTAFGLGQRDEHTIASELARAAWRDGVAVDIVNRGVVGDHHWEEANRFAWDLATLPAPDVVVFLDGINDVQAVDRMREDSRQPLSFIKDDFWRNYLSVADDRMDPRWAPSAGDEGAPPGASVPETVPLSFDSAEAAGAYVAKRYEIARKISAASAAQAGVEAEWFWQPAIEDRPAIEGEPPPSGREWSLDRYRAAYRGIGPPVHDISHALDGMDEPLYWDQFHTNERGAARVGQVMYRVLRTELRALARERPR